MKLTLISALLLTPLPLLATTTFLTDSAAVGGGQWDVWTQASETVTTGLSQGSAQSTFGSNTLTSSLVTTDILQGYEFPGGFLGNPDTYYIHTGAFAWNAALTLTDAVSHVRVSYSLVGGFGPITAFGNGPILANATLLTTGSYATDNSTVFFSDFEFNTPSNTIETSFGDAVFPNFPGSFRSIDAIQVEGLNIAPSAIPEPSSSLLFLVAGSLLALRSRIK